MGGDLVPVSLEHRPVVEQGLGDTWVCAVVLHCVLCELFACVKAAAAWCMQRALRHGQCPSPPGSAAVAHRGARTVHAAALEHRQRAEQAQADTTHCSTRPNTHNTHNTTSHTQNTQQGPRTVHPAALEHRQRREEAQVAVGQLRAGDKSRAGRLLQMVNMCSVCALQTRPSHRWHVHVRMWKLCVTPQPSQLVAAQCVQ